MNGARLVPRTPAEWLAVAAGLAVFGYVGWDAALWDARLQLLLHLLGIGAMLALVLTVIRGGDVPRTAVDLPLLALIAAFALATVSALNVGMSLRAMAAIIGFAAMLPAAILAVRHRPTWVGLVTSVPVLLIAIPTLLDLLARRLDWIRAGAPGLPPLRLVNEATPFGSVAVPPFVVIPAWALAGLIEPDGIRRVVRTGLVIVGVPLTILSGSRSAWLAIAVAALVGVAPYAWRRRGRLTARRRWTPGSVAIALGALVLIGLAVVLVVPRLTAVTSLFYRAALWRDTLLAWASDPLLGIGPGFMPYARMAAAPDDTFPVRQPHSHNLPLGVLGDAGLVGLAAGIVLVVTLLVVAGPWRSRTRVGRTAAVVLLGLGVGGLFEDLTFLPGFCLLAIALMAVALLDARAVTWVHSRTSLPWLRRAALAAGAVMGVVLLGAMVVADAGAIAYRTGVDAAAAERWDDATRWLTRAVEVDRWQPTGPRALAVAADGAREATIARDAAGGATLLGPGDGTAWVNLALICGERDDRTCQADAARDAVASARYGSPELLNAALALEDAGDTAGADAAYRLALLTYPTTAFVLEWPRVVDIGDGEIPDYTDASWQLNVLLAKHAMGEAIEPETYDDHAVRALAHAIRDERAEADALLDTAIESTPEDPRVWDIAIVVRDAWGEPVDELIRIASAVRGRPFPTPDTQVNPPRISYDILSFRAFPRDGLVAAATRLLVEPPYPWILAEVLP